MIDVLTMAWRYTARHRITSLILVGSIALIVFIPAALRVLVHQGQQELTARARDTPLLLGPRNSPLELALGALYFSIEAPATIPYDSCAAVRASDLAAAIPLSVRFRAQENPIVGTTLEYLRLRGLRVAEGRRMTVLGECMLGASVAADRALGPGDHVVSSPESVFDLAGVYPLRMRVSGVLAPNGTPDDHAVFVDVRTAWVIEGLGHGHDDLSRPESARDVLRRDGDHVVANAAVREYQEITPETIGSFHMHGDTGTFPITAVIVVPHDVKSATILRGRYQSDDRLQLIDPSVVVDDLLQTVFSVQHVVIASLAVVGATTLALVALVFLLSIRLRRGEIQTMSRIGGSRGRIAAILGTEILGVLITGVLVAIVLTWCTARLGADAIQMALRQ